MSYLGWLKITASRPGAARKATTRGAAGCEDRGRCTPCASSGAAQAKTRPQPLDLHGRFSSRTRGSGAAVFLEFQGEDGGESWGQRAKRAGPRTNALAWLWGVGVRANAQRRAGRPLPCAPMSRCRWRTLPRQSAPPARAPSPCR